MGLVKWGKAKCLLAEVVSDDLGEMLGCGSGLSFYTFRRTRKFFFAEAHRK